MKKLKRILRSSGAIIVGTMCFFLSACAGGFDVDEYTEDNQFGIPMDNVKILRRSYGDSKATKTAHGFYLDYSKNLIQYLDSIYGNINYFHKAGTANIFEDLYSWVYENENAYEPGTRDLLEDLSGKIAANNDCFKYYYDAIRYQIVEESVCKLKPKWKKVDGETTLYSNAESQPEGYVGNGDVFLSTACPSGITQAEFSTSPVVSYSVTADTSYGWSWGVDYALTSAEAFVYAIGGVVSGNTITAEIETDDYHYNSGARNGFSGYYKSDKYREDGVEFDQPTYNNNLYHTGANDPTGFEKALTYVIYCIVNNETPAEVVATKSATGTTFAVEGFADVDAALERAKTTYENKAAYVGLTENDQEKVVEYILNNVIGEAALTQSNKATSKQDLHYEEIVPAVVKYCSTLTQTGYTEVGGTLINKTTIGGQYLSSDIVDYAYTSSYVNFDAAGFDEFAHLGDYEYQSMMLMPMNGGKLDEIWLDFGYRGDGIGENDKIEIVTYIRYYKGNGEFDVFSDTITVRENHVDAGEEGTTLTFDFSELTSEKYLECDIIDFDDAINSQQYKVRKSGTPLPLGDLSKEIIIGGQTEARNYYSLIEGTYRDYGVFNHKLLEGTEYYGKKYVEIAFEVKSATCEQYKFFCGIATVTDYMEIDYSKFQ